MNSYQIDTPMSDLKSTLTDVFLRLLWVKDYMNNLAHYSHLKKIRGTKKTSDALIIGNGPSLDLIPIEAILDFQNNGGEIFVLNFYQRRVDLLKIIPDYYFSADPNTIESTEFKEILNSVGRLKNCSVYTSSKLIKNYERLFPNNSVHAFCGLEIRRNLFTKNKSIRPDRPHSFSSMTAFHAISLAVWLKYKNIYIIGIDNTYAQSVYCDSENRIVEVLKHASTPDRLIDRSEEYASIFDFYYENIRLFKDLSYFKDKNILNLDPNSLVDAFKKPNSISESINLLRNK